MGWPQYAGWVENEIWYKKKLKLIVTKFIQFFFENLHHMPGTSPLMNYTKIAQGGIRTHPLLLCTQMC